MRTETVDLTRLGRIDVADLTVISEFVGHEFLPFPLVPTLPHRFGHFDEYDAHARALPDRFNHGDLQVFKKWFAGISDADLRVECRVQHFGSDTPTERFVAHRSGQVGFLAIQRPDDAVDIFTLSPYDLGPAIAASVGLTKPGAHAAVVIPEYVPQSLRDREDEVGNPGATVHSAEVSTYATVQSHRRPARDWGVDQHKAAVVWVSLRDDGDYIYVPEYDHARPMTRPVLRDRVDQLIAADVAWLRRTR